MQHDKLATRLSIILYKLNQGERLSVEELAEEFGVTERTIQRDLIRFSWFNLKKENKRYFLSENEVGKLNFTDIKNFAIFSGLKSLFPSLSQEFLKNIIEEKMKKAYIINDSGFEDIVSKKDLFENLSSAILNQNKISFIYNDKKRELSPYKLINTNGIWYLCALESNNMKSYSFSKIKNLMVYSEKFKLDEKVLEKIEEGSVNFLSKDLKEVHLKIDNSAKEYFLRKKVLQNMKMVENKDEYFIVSTNIAFDDEILNIVKYWLPYIQIIKPLELQKKLEDILKDYLKKPNI
ncbi:helix-turn-helix transcriptional regulator [Arcobacter porcinus]|uniref:Transcriptional regulator (WYL domain) n=1 Tax=Arcobacter porcinus TaxID=1935204 RepID=A0A5C2HHL4_9BACT|nr:WYL domain-containing protein [Arcobacter porcinus]OCL97192.1 HTH domain protein [Aliarcobacter thereius]QEP39808.1 transcriptional regulator (WYL domain) [Arcobacter porcinus]